MTVPEKTACIRCIFGTLLVLVLIYSGWFTVVWIIEDRAQEQAYHNELIDKTHKYIYRCSAEKDSTKQVECWQEYRAFRDSVSGTKEGE